MTSDIAKIAAGLTKAQREAILNAEEMGWWPDNILVRTDVPTNTWRKLVDHWLIDPSEHSRRLTPLGLAVRAHLLAASPLRGEGEA